MGAGGLEFCFQGLLLMFRREMSWQEANLLWDSLFARHAVLVAHAKIQCPGCSRPGDNVQGEDQQPGVHSQHQNQLPRSDVLRSLFVDVAVALLISHRVGFLQCRSLEEVVQLSNRLPDLGAGSGLRLARLASMAFDLVIEKHDNSKNRLLGWACSCIGPHVPR